MAGLQFIRGKLVLSGENEPTFEVDRRIYVNADKSKVVDEHSPEAAYLLGAPGHRIPMAEARKLGLVAEDEPEDKATGKPEDKAMAKPADKAVRMPANKGQGK